MVSRNQRSALITSRPRHLLITLIYQTKKKRPSRRQLADAEVADDGMAVDQPSVPIVRDLDANFVDDDELQAALARSRNAKLRKTKKLSPEELAKKSKPILQ